MIIYVFINKIHEQKAVCLIYLDPFLMLVFKVSRQIFCLSLEILNTLNYRETCVYRICRIAANGCHMQERGGSEEPGHWPASLKNAAPRRTTGPLRNVQQRGEQERCPYPALAFHSDAVTWQSLGIL